MEEEGQSLWALWWAGGQVGERAGLGLAPSGGGAGLQKGAGGWRGCAFQQQQEGPALPS